ncbi:hypothetical protein SUGI_0817640 [Cryptomeria japonica]|uniref:MLO-like protein 9 n=1 Tax=Cryptomeria japonica TaxID=3369 RepID=UPI002414C30F|nr:MLO-like protein 9 [Cryptomeria japonica]GLJ39966.1 hypothetical protein SUGI_0817640 [Cryptomeria japonica]
MAASAGERSLEETPTWAVAAVCLVFIVISIILEQAIHHAGKWLLARNKKSLYEALDKIKSELMLLGFISLLLTIGQQPISKICISKKVAYSMLPCDKKKVSESKYETGDEHRRKLLWASMSSDQEVPWRRVLAASAGGLDHCSQKGMYPLVSQGGMHQLHIFIFILAILHVLYSVITMALGRAKMRRWKSWEMETQTMEYQFSNDPARFRFTRETSFVRRHTTFWSRTPILKWIVCFFRQFFWSVPKVDYLALRHGFIVAHLAPNSKLNFQKYIRRSLDDDFKVVVGISPPLWAFAVVFLLLNVSGWYAYFWLSFVPLCIVLLVGTKLQAIITDMAIEIHERHAVVKGTPVVQPSDKRFWFNRPKLVLFLIHFTLFQNAFQLAFFLWIWYEFGLRSCFHSNFTIIMIRVAMGIAVQFLCSYITLPLYALVTQMGSHMRKAIFEDQTANALKKWQQNAKKNRKKGRRSELSGSGFRSGETTPSHGSSPIHMLHRYKTMGDIENPDIAHRYYHSEYETSDYEMEQSPSPSPPHPVFPHPTQPASTTETEKTAEATRQQSTANKSNDITDFSFAMESTEIVGSNTI